MMKGFTLIELLVVFSIIAFVSTMGFASFVSYSNQQTLLTAYQEARTEVQAARSQTISQANLCPANQTFGGYQVLFCCASGSGDPLCPACISGDTQEHYETNIYCGGAPISVRSKRFPSHITVGNTSTSRAFLFLPLTGLVTGSGQVAITGYGQTKTITVSNVGVVQ